MIANLKVEDLVATFPVIWALLNSSSGEGAAELLKVGASDPLFLDCGLLRY